MSLNLYYQWLLVVFFYFTDNMVAVPVYWTGSYSRRFVSAHCYIKISICSVFGISISESVKMVLPAPCWMVQSSVG